MPAASESKGMDGILTPVLQITPELHELCVESSVVLPLELGSFGKELCGLLASLMAMSPRYGNDIACVLAGKALEDIIRKVKKSRRKVTIWNKRRKRNVARKASATT
jgi:hypothetical protein